MALRPIEGRLQTAEHILVAVLKKEFGARPGISKFYEDHGTLEMHTDKDMKAADLGELEGKVDEVVLRDLPVTRTKMSREDAGKIVDISRVPEGAKELTVVDIVGYYAAACRDPHVEHTAQIGKFILSSVERVGKDRYRFEFEVE
jgi:misacylated tRNA(Ala) deacylase